MKNLIVTGISMGLLLLYCWIMIALTIKGYYRASEIMTSIILLALGVGLLYVGVVILVFGVTEK